MDANVTVSSIKNSEEANEVNEKTAAVRPNFGNVMAKVLF
jgi:hypothetical protein